MTVSSILNDPPPRPAEVFPGYDPALEAICLRCLEKDPDRRFGSAGELAEALAPMAMSTATEAALSALVEDLATDEEKERWEHPVEEEPEDGATLLLEDRGSTEAQGGASTAAGTPRPQDRTPGAGDNRPTPSGIGPGATLQMPSEVAIPPGPVRAGPTRTAGGSRRGRTVLGVVIGVLGIGAAGLGGYWIWQETQGSEEVQEVSPSREAFPEPPKPTEPRRTRLVVKSAPSASLEVDGQICGIGRCEMEVTPGTHRVRVQVTGFQKEQEVSVAEGRTTEVEVLPPAGSLVLRVPAGVEVFLDGKSVGRGPFVRPVQTWAGVHTVRMVPSRGKPVIRSVTLTPDRPEVTISWP